MDALRASTPATQFSQTDSVDKAQVSTGWRPGKLAGQAAGRLSSIFGFKASVASSPERNDRIAQNDVKKQSIVDELAATNEKIRNLQEQEIKMLAVPGGAKPESIKAGFAKKLTPLQEKANELTTQLRQLIKGESPAKATAPSTSRSSSPTTVSRPPSPATTKSPQNLKQAELKQYNEDIKQIATNEKMLNQPAGFLSADARSKIAQDTWVRQQRVDAYQQKNPKV